MLPGRLDIARAILVGRLVPAGSDGASKVGSPKSDPVGEEIRSVR